MRWKIGCQYLELIQRSGRNIPLTGPGAGLQIGAILVEIDIRENKPPVSVIGSIILFRLMHVTITDYHF